jgi:phosphoglycerate dehydrogenase-like enzyme
MPLSKETERIIGAAEFAKMKQGAIFIDGSRGRVVDQVALIQSLESVISARPVSMCLAWNRCLLITYC